MHDDLRALILSVVEPLVRYARPYIATVMQQHADGSVDLRPDSPKIDKPTRVTIRTLPGVEVKVQPGTRVLLEYEDGDRTRPFARLAGSDGLLELKITATTKVRIDAPAIELADAIAPVLRDGDYVTVGSTAGVITLAAPPPPPIPPPVPVPVRTASRVKA